MEGSSNRIRAETLGNVTVDGQPRTIDINPGTKRFAIRVGELVAFLTFGVRESALLLIHTEVPAALRGRGLAETIARAALDYARTHEMTVNPYCPFVAKFIQRHPEYQSLVG